MLTSWGIDHGVAGHQGPQIVNNIAVYAAEHADQAVELIDVLIEVLGMEAKKEVGSEENR